MNSLNLDTSLVLKKEDPEARKAQPISKGNKTSTRSEEVIGIHFRVQSTKAPSNELINFGRANFHLI